MNRITTFLWTLKVIKGCQTLKHLDSCVYLVQYNYDLYEDIGIFTFLRDVINTMIDNFKNEIEQACLKTNEYLEQ